MSGSLVLLAVIMQGKQAIAQMPPSSVRIDEVRLENVEERRRVTGDLRAIARSRVATSEGGLVLTLPVVEGQLVKKGDVLATIDSRRLNLMLLRVKADEEVAKATVAQRLVDVEVSQRDYDSILSLSQRQASNPKQLADAQSKLRIEEARRDQAQRQLEVNNALAELLETRLLDTSIMAPFDGVVVRKHTEIGEWIGEGDVVLELVAIGQYDAWLDIPQRLASAIIGQDIMIQVSVESHDCEFKPTKPRVIRLVDPTARTFNIVVRLTDEDNTLAPGMAVIGWAPTGKHGEYLTIDKDGLMLNPEGYFVYIVREMPERGLVVMPASVQIEFDMGPRLAVSSGSIHVGDRIVVEGNERLYPTAPVSITTPATAGSSDLAEVSRK
ncbi:MAG: efflux RND transporter periplasmic adaptor subunit [Planctomycetota bacterium]|nr:efflux RND transporter periplasmic adaptor subunit [Planctomycetota bacterium]